MNRLLLALAIVLAVRFGGLPARDGPGTVGQNLDRAALEALYAATNGAHWRANDGWLTGSEPTAHCAWFGVACDVAGRVVSLALPANNLNGPLPAELAGLSSLQQLNLGGNELSGSLPPQLGRLGKLQQLLLWGNALSGPLPPELGQLHHLQSLRLNGNDLSGPIPPQLGGLTAVHTLWLHDNQLSGPIPDQLGQLSNLRSLRLQHNDLSGPVPASLQNLRRLENLNLRANQLSCWQTNALLQWAIAVQSADWNHPYPGRLLCAAAEVENLTPTPEAVAGSHIPVEALTSLFCDH